MKAPSIWKIRNLVKSCEVNMANIRGFGWVPSRPIGLETWPNRFKAAWLVFTGKADAVKWDGQ